MQTRGYTLIELLVGAGIILSAFLFVFQYNMQISHYFSRAVRYYQNLVQINNIQHVVNKDITKSESVNINAAGDCLIMSIDGDTIKYYSEQGYLIREKNIRVKLNSDEILVDKFRVCKVSNLVKLDYAFFLQQKEKMELKDAVYVW